MDRVDSVAVEQSEAGEARAGNGPITKPAESHFKLVRAKDVTPKPIQWLWDRRIVRGKLNALAGLPGLGKTTILCDVVARLTTGRPLPGETRGKREPVKCWYLTNEDDIEDTLLPLLKQAGADLDLVYLTEEDAQLHKKGVSALEEEINRHNFALVIIDSLTSWLPEGSDNNALGEITSFLKPFRMAAKRTGCAILFVRHWAKSATASKKATAAIGSIGQTAMFRCELSVLNEKGVMVLERTKGNLAPPGRLTYAIRGKSPDAPGYVEWFGVSETPLEQSEAAKKFLREQLKGGAKATKALRGAADKQGIPWEALERVKKELGIRSFQVTGARHGEAWHWSSLPDQKTQSDDPDGGCVREPVRPNGPASPSSSASEFL